MSETSICIGAKATKKITVTREKLACAVGSGSVEVFATPMVVALMESAAAELAQSTLAEPYTTVGTMISIDHTSPTVEGMTVTAEAELTGVEGRKYVFSVRAWDEAGPISQGTHERVSVKKESFLSKARQRGEGGGK